MRGVACFWVCGRRCRSCYGECRCDSNEINTESKYNWTNEVNFFHTASDGTLRVAGEAKGGKAKGKGRLGKEKEKERGELSLHT